MERHILNNEAASHIDAYMEYRMIVGKRDNGVLLPEHEYGKLRKEFYAKREQNNFHNVDYSFLEGAVRPRKALEQGKDDRQKPSNSRRIFSKEITALELFETEPFQDLPMTTSSSNSRMRAIGTSSRSVVPRTRISQPTSSTVSSRPSSSSSSSSSSKPKSTSSQVVSTSLMTEDEKLEYLTEQLNSTSISEAKKFAIKKEIKMIKANQIKRERKAKQIA